MSEIATGRKPRRWQGVAVPVLAVLLAALAGGVLLWTIKGHQTSPSVVPVAIVFLLSQRALVRGLVGGGVKE